MARDGEPTATGSMWEWMRPVEDKGRRNEEEK
jgi:hypothetical protein